MIAFENYVKIKNNYCICYFGICNEYLVLLDLLKSKIKEKFDDINFYIGCKDESLSLFDNKDEIFPISELKIRKSEFAHIRELKLSNLNHPIEEFLKECNIENTTLCNQFHESQTKKAIIITKSNYPTNPMNDKQIKFAVDIAEKRGFEVEFSDNWENSGLVIGVESVSFVRAAHLGIPVILADNGIGTEFYKKIFPSLELLNILS